ncbi:MAG TPA: hypothetical protein VF662_16515 [Allosphingosinicella sp.]|jgi:hypothetical protein
MIKLVSVSIAGDRALDLRFSDGSAGRWSAAELIALDTVLTRPLTDRAYFGRAFIRQGRLPGGTDSSFPARALTGEWRKKDF